MLTQLTSNVHVDLEQVSCITAHTNLIQNDTLPFLEIHCGGITTILAFAPKQEDVFLQVLQVLFAKNVLGSTSVKTLKADFQAKFQALRNRGL